MLRPLILATLVSASLLGAQAPESMPAPAAFDASPVVTIDAGMTRADVVARLGAPAAERKAGAFTYLFFANGCPRSCGMDDLVILEDGRVADAIFRGDGRRYSGTSSSPAGVTPVATLGPRASRVGGEPTAFDAPAPSMAAPPARRAVAADPGAPFDEPAEPAGRSTPAAAPAPATMPVPAPAVAPMPVRPSLATSEPSETPAAAPARPAAPARRAPVDAFRIVPVVPDSAAKRAPSDTTSARP